MPQGGTEFGVKTQIPVHLLENDEERSGGWKMRPREQSVAITSGGSLLASEKSLTAFLVNAKTVRVLRSRG